MFTKKPPTSDAFFGQTACSFSLGFISSEWTNCIRLMRDEESGGKFMGWFCASVADAQYTQLGSCI